jgi:hypothetical protein
MITTIKQQENGYLVNGNMLVPMAEGNRDYREALEALEGGTENYPIAIVVEPEFTAEELLQQIEDAKPKVVTMRQARLVLLQSNLLATIETAIITGTDEAMKIEWEYATEVRKDWASLVTLTESLGMTSTELDSLFTIASTL